MLRSADCPEGVPPLSLEGSGPGSAPAAFGPFRVLHQLGAGTLGPVFRAHDPVEGRLVAVKAFKLDLTPEHAVELSRTLNDLVTRELNHPTIAAPIASGLEGSTTWLAQAYVPAESLDAALRQFGPAPIAHVVTMLTHLAGALDFAAAAGVVHGSLHPRDVLVVPGEAFLIDIGVAPALERCGLRPPIRRPYSAPERITGGPASRAADVFALAAIAVELLTGQPVVGAGEGALPAFPEIPGADMHALEAAFASALATDPDARPSTALAFASAFKAALGAASFRTTPAVVARRTPRSMPMLPLDEPDVDQSLPATAARSAEPPTDVEPLPALVEERAISGITPAVASAREPAPDLEPHRSPAAITPAPFASTHDDDGDYRAQAAESHRRNDTERDELDLELTSSEDRAPRPRAHPVPTAPPPFHPARRSMPAAVVLIVLAAALTGFGIGWIWSNWSGAAIEHEPRQAAVEPESASTSEATDGTGPETKSPVPEASSGVEPQTAAVPAAVASAPESPEADEPQREEVPAATLGRLLVRSSPAGASVRVNGRARGQTPLTLRNLPLGSHTIVVSRPGYAPQCRTVRLTSDRASRSLQVSLREAAPVRPPARQAFTGSMVVESRPRAARVVLNGEEVGRTPLTLPSVRAGSHVVRLEMDGYRTWTASVRVVAGERNRVTASLEEMP